nr:hypothetical protein [Bacillus pumilus]
MILSTIMLCDWLHVKYHDEMNIKTKDLGGNETTTQFTAAFIKTMN